MFLFICYYPENCCAFCVEVEDNHAGHKVVGAKSFHRDHSQALEDKQIDSLKESMFGVERILEQVSDEIKRVETVYNKFREVLDKLEHENCPLSAVKDELWGDFHGIYSRVAEALKAAQLKSGSGEALSVVAELCEYASKLSVSIVDGRAQVAMNVGLSVRGFKRRTDDEKAVVVYFDWKTLVVPKVFSARKPDTSYLAQVFDPEKSAWVGLPEKDFRGYELKNFDSEKGYKFRMLVKVKFPDDPKTYTIFTEEHEHKFARTRAKWDALEKVSVTEYSIKPAEQPPADEKRNFGKEYEDISNLSFEKTAYKGTLIEGSNYKVTGDGMVYVKSGLDGWTGCCRGSDPISKLGVTRWYVRIARSAAGWCLLGVIAGDYASNSKDSMWALSLHNSRIALGSPHSINDRQRFEKSIARDKLQSFCFEVDPSERKLSMSLEEDFEKFYVLTKDLPMDREIFPLIMGFNRKDTLELLREPPKGKYRRISYPEEDEGVENEEEDVEKLYEDDDDDDDGDDDDDDDVPRFGMDQGGLHQLRRSTQRLSSIISNILSDNGSSSSLFSNDRPQEGSDRPQERNSNSNSNGSNNNSNSNSNNGSDDGVSCKIQ